MTQNEKLTLITAGATISESMPHCPETPQLYEEYRDRLADHELFSTPSLIGEYELLDLPVERIDFLGADVAKQQR